MIRLIAFRALQVPLVLAIIYVLTFLLVWVVPGSPFQGEKNIDKQILQQMQEKYHADSAKNFLANYPKNIILHGDFGPSLQYRDWTVNDIIKSSLPVSMLLGVLAIVVAAFLGISVGTLAAVKRGGVLDWLSLTVTLAGISVPSFVFAAVLLIVTATYLPGVFAVGRFAQPIDVVLPVMALVLAPMAVMARLTRVSMLDVLGSDYVRTARSKGVSKFWVVWKHCLRNAMLPVLSYLGPATAGTMVGSFVVEQVFNIPGLGKHFVNSVINRDQTLILGVVMVYSTFLLLMNLLVDVLYGLVDPRIDVAGGGQ